LEDCWRKALPEFFTAGATYLGKRHPRSHSSR